MKLTNAELRVLASSIFQHFHRLDTPPADEIFVPVDNIKQDQDEAMTYHASVRFITNYCSRRAHSVRIKFNIDPKGRFLAKTFQYV